MTSGSNNGIVFRKAALTDLDSLKKLVDQHKTELGFVIRGALAKSIENSEVIVAIEQNGEVIGFVQYRHRKDEQTTLYNIVVVSSHQRQGIGHQLIDRLENEARAHQKQFILLKCPAGLPANDFYRDYGFTLHTIENGKNRALNVWKLDV